MRRLGWLVPVCLAAAQGCVREAPVRVEDRNLGIVVVFPGKPRLHKFSEPTPFGQMEWFSTTYEPPGRFDRSFFVNVGNLPPGDQGGSTEPEVLDTYRTKYKFTEVEHLEREELVKPMVSQQAALLAASTALNGNGINAHHIQSDGIVVERLHLYWRPVFAFEFMWSSADKRGVIEVTGLTGEVSGSTRRN